MKKIKDLHLESQKSPLVSPKDQDLQLDRDPQLGLDPPLGHSEKLRPKKDVLHVHLNLKEGFLHKKKGGKMKDVVQSRQNNRKNHQLKGQLLLKKDLYLLREGLHLLRRDLHLLRGGLHLLREDLSLHKRDQ